MVHALPSAVLITSVALLAASVALGGVELFRPGSPPLARLGRAATIGLGLPLLGFVAAYLGGIVGAALSSSPYRSPATVLCAPLVIMLAIVQYGRGFIHWHRVLKPRLVHQEA
jgi:hypothetical protein